MANSELADSGGAYFDADSGGVGGVASRWYSQAKGTVLSGDVATSVVAFVIGGVVANVVSDKVTN